MTKSFEQRVKDQLGGRSPRAMGRPRTASATSSAPSAPVVDPRTVQFAALPYRQTFAFLAPELHAPEHFAPLLDRLEAIEAGTLKDARVCVSSPPQHGKSTSLLVWVVWLLARAEASGQRTKILYVTHSESLSIDQKREAARFAQTIGLKLEIDNNTNWQTEGGSVVKWTSVNGSITGFSGARYIVVDDPIKGSDEANSEAERIRLLEWFEKNVLTRATPGVGVILCATRWHEADLMSHYVNSGRWDYLHFPAIRVDDDGTEHALWPVGRPLDWLCMVRESADPGAWLCMYQGKPGRPEGPLFKAPKTWETLPAELSNYSIGVDLCYSGTGDYSVAVVLGYFKDKIYLIEVHRSKTKWPDFNSTLVELQERYRCNLRIDVGPTERAFLEAHDRSGESAANVAWDIQHAMKNKLERAAPAAGAWNSGRLLVPAVPVANQAELVAEVMQFDGSRKGHDDCVDALASAFASCRPAIHGWQWLGFRVLPF